MWKTMEFLGVGELLGIRSDIDGNHSGDTNRDIRYNRRGDHKKVRLKMFRQKR